MMSTNRSPSKISTSTRSPTFNPLTSSPGASTSTETSRRNFTGGRLCLAKCPRIGLVRFFSFTNSTRPICADSYPSLVLFLCCVITHGPACNTVAGRTSPFESKSCVMPTFLPRIPETLAISFSVPAWLADYFTAAIGWVSYSSNRDRERPTTNDQRLFMFLSKRLNPPTHARRQIELHQRIDCLLRRLQNIEQPLVGADFKLLPRFLIDMRRPQHPVLVLHRGR